MWTTAGRQPIIDAQCEAILRATFQAKATELRLHLHAVGNVADHVHVALGIPPGLSVSAVVKHLKGASSRAVNVCLRSVRAFRWQEGYGALTMTIDARSLSSVILYVRAQPQHHRQGTVQSIYEMIEDEGRRQSPSDDFFPS